MQLCSYIQLCFVYLEIAFYYKFTIYQNTQIFVDYWLPQEQKRSYVPLGAKRSFKEGAFL